MSVRAYEMIDPNAYSGIGYDKFVRLSDYSALESRVKELERENKITLKALYLQDAQAVCKPCECSQWLDKAEEDLIKDGEIEQRSQNDIQRRTYPTKRLP